MRRGYTLIEVLIVVVVLGIMGALIVPSMGTTSVLRIQASVRAIVSDITFAQSDALAYQQRRAVVFDTGALNGYTLVEVKGAVIDPVADAMYDPGGPGGRYIVSLNDPRFGGAQITFAEFDGDAALIFDEMGGPVIAPDSDTPSSGGRIIIEGSDQVFQITVEAFTGRVTVQKLGP